MQLEMSVSSLIRFIQMSYPHSNSEARRFFDHAVTHVNSPSGLDRIGTECCGRSRDV